MEKLKTKHDHKLTDILKVGIFGLFLILPLLVFLPSGLYYGFNEHAKVPEETNVVYNYKYETNEVNTLDDLVVGNLYHFTDLYIFDNSQYFELCVVNADILDIPFNTYYGQRVNQYYNSNEGNYIKIVNDESLSLHVLFTNSNVYAEIIPDEVDFNSCDLIIVNGLEDFKSFLTDNDYTLPTASDFNVIESVTVETDETPSITTKMSNAWVDMWQSPLFAWTNNTNFIFTINAFTNVFGITSASYITNYLTYILTLTVIYVIFDIVLTIFTIITHIFNKN